MDFSKTVCYWYKMNGECKENEEGDCPYAHSFDQIELCRRWREGTCPYIVECHHRHYYLEEELDTLEITICRKWQKGECIIPSDCAFRHFYTEEDEQVEESKRFSGPNQGPSIQFTGPINVKVTKETRELKQEQYDLDTGEIRTWVETEEYEVVDLTEDTPVRVVRTGSITHHVDLTEEVEEPTVERERKPLADLRNRLGISHLPEITGSKFSNSTSNLSLDISSVRSSLRSTSTPLLSKSGMENESFDESNVSSTFGSSLLLGESPSKRHKLSNSTSDVSLNESSVGSWDLELVRSRLLSVGTKVEGIRRRRRNSLRV